jgi:hypothetical protein
MMQFSVLLDLTSIIADFALLGIQFVFKDFITTTYENQCD